MLIKTPENHFGLIDAGRSGTSISRIPSYVDRFDFIIISHYDADHAEGLLDIIQKYEIKNIFINKGTNDLPLAEELAQIIDEKKIRTFQPFEDNDFMIDGVTFDFIWPTEKDVSLGFSSLDSNDSSLSLIIRYQDFSVLSMGDLSSKYEDALISLIQENAEDLDVLKVSHHGSKNSTSEEFVSSLNPKYYVLSYGSNSYGHPSPEVLNNIEGFDPDQKIILDTYKQGDISFSTDGVSISVRTENK